MSVVTMKEPMTIPATAPVLKPDDCDVLETSVHSIPFTETDPTAHVVQTVAPAVRAKKGQTRAGIACLNQSTILGVLGTAAPLWHPTLSLCT